MNNLSYIGLSQQVALQRLMDVTANNIANMNTTGFKSQNVMFSEYINKPQDNGTKISQVQDDGTYRDLGQGTLTLTSNNLDFSVQGDGYFSVQTPTGTKYTRDGSFALNNTGVIVTKEGYSVLGDNGSPLTVPAGAHRVSADPTGNITTEKGPVGKLKLSTFANPQMIVPVGGNLLDANGNTEQPVANPHVVQGMLESSNVQPILEMNKMIEISRMYTTAQTMLVADHQRISTAIQTLTKT